MIKKIDNNRFYNNFKGCINNTTRITSSNGVDYIEFTPFDRFDWLKLAFSTRVGGVSKDFSASMNFTYERGDTKENVLKNFEIFTNSIGASMDKCVLSKQTHTTNVLKVDESKWGMGLTKDRDYDNIDGLITNVRETVLVTAFADCVPVYFVDSRNKCIGASHSGWRGTVDNITHNTVKLMKKEFGTDPKDLYTFIGPSICMDCYEVSKDVAEKFYAAYATEECERIIKEKGADKYLLNLHMANYYNMLHEGIPEENIGITDMCTKCNSDYLFSHRATNGKRGVLCGFMFIK